MTLVCLLSNRKCMNKPGNSQLAQQRWKPDHSGFLRDMKMEKANENKNIASRNSQLLFVQKQAWRVW